MRALDILDLHGWLLLDSRGVHCSVICPYYIDTGMFAGVNPGVLPLLKPRQVVNAVDMLAGWDVDDACHRVRRSLCNMSAISAIHCLSYPELIPGFDSFTAVCRLLLPYPFVMHCFKVLGVLEYPLRQEVSCSSMNTFTGRKTKQEWIVCWTH